MELACITSALWAKQGEHDISHSFRASRKMPRSPRLAHKAPVMPATVEQNNNKNNVQYVIGATIVHSHC